MYNNIAGFYNRYTTDIDYGKIADYLEKIFRKFGLPERSDGGKVPMILDVACGTGNLTCILAERGYEMIGLDMSEEMLAEAEERAAEKNIDILWLCQDMCKMDMYGTVSAMVCITDGINHITSDASLKRFFMRIKNFIDDGGLFVFDALSEKYFETVVGTNTFFDDSDEGTCIWTSNYNKNKKICRYNVTFFELYDAENELYERFDDTVCEKAWSDEDITNASKDAGFTVEKVFNGTTMKEASDDSLRKFYVLRKNL
ncbi:MAG: class I SAM-dependent methyltransferase [Clostridia bacterium]|nr:class I SAM-dependent methyltransferase [Clostridia bacterium]